MERLRRCAFAPALAALLAAPPALAHGGRFRADQVRVDPTDAAHIVVRSDVWGLVETRDGGTTWEWTCAEVAAQSSITLQRRPFTVAPGGNVLIGSGFDGLMVARGSLCAMAPVPQLAAAGACGSGSCVPYDVFVDMPRSRVVAVTSSLEPGLTYVNRLWSSPDGGTSWSTLGVPPPADIFVGSARVAPSDPLTIYAGGVTLAVPPEFLLLRSHDGGATWERVALPVQARAGDFPTVVRIHAVHPSDAGVVFIWLDRDSGDRTVPAPDRLFVSTDGGVTIRGILDGSDDLPGLEFSSDGNRVFVGATGDGLVRASMADVRAAAGTPFQQVNAGPTWGLAALGTGLLAGRDDYRATPPRMSLGISHDEGVTFDPVLGICDVKLAQCPSGSPGYDRCSGLFYRDPTVEIDLTPSFESDQQAARCAPDGSPDGSTGAGDEPVGKGGCACRAGTRSTGEGGEWVLLAVAAVLRRRRPKSTKPAAP